MEIRANYIVTGAFTLAVIVGVFGLIFWLHNIGGGGERISYRVVFYGSVSGLRAGGTVLFNGIRVGEVSGLALDTQDPRKVKATISIDHAVPVRADTRVALAFQGLTGLAEVSLTGGAADAAPLVADHGAPPTLYAGASAGADVTQAARDVLSRINGLVVGNETALRSSLRNIETVTATLAQNSQRLDKVMAGLENLTGSGDKAGDHPGKAADEASRIRGNSLALDGKMFSLLSAIYLDSDRDCPIEIWFNQREDGTQQNPCRDLIVAYLGEPTVPRGRQLAERLEKVTTHRSGLGLLFLLAGKEGRQHKIVISRFPADVGILAEESERALTVEFLERVFMKRATTYKAAAYQDTSLSAGFWLGRAVDKQINSDMVQLSNYWIAEFLDSDFRTAAAAGTKRLAVALRDAARKSADVTVKTEIAAAVTLGQSLNGQRLSINEFASRFGLSSGAQDALAGEIKNPAVLDERFQFDAKEFVKQVPYRVVVQFGASS
jgi:hypothetical protein